MANQDLETVAGEVMGPLHLRLVLETFVWLGTNSSNPIPSMLQTVKLEARVGMALSSTRVGVISGHRHNWYTPAIVLCHLVEAEGTCNQEL